MILHQCHTKGRVSCGPSISKSKYKISKIRNESTFGQHSLIQTIFFEKQSIDRPMIPYRTALKYIALLFSEISYISLLSCRRVFLCLHIHFIICFGRKNTYFLKVCTKKKIQNLTYFRQFFFHLNCFYV